MGRVIMVDWVCGSLGRSLILRLHLTTLLQRLGLQMTSFTRDGNTETFWLHFSIVEGSRDASSSIFFYSLWFEQRYSVQTHNPKRITLSLNIFSKYILINIT